MDCMWIFRLALHFLAHHLSLRGPWTRSLRLTWKEHLKWETPQKERPAPNQRGRRLRTSLQEETGKSAVFSLSALLCVMRFNHDSFTNSFKWINSLQTISSIDLTEDSPASTRKPSEEDDEKLSMISWNVDGLDTDNLAERARGLCSFLVL